jgi:hypothetical protein
MSDMVARRLGWRRGHETVLQWFLKYPSGLCADCARATGYSATHVSRITLHRGICRANWEGFRCGK